MGKAEMQVYKLDLNTYPRKSHFEYFKKMAYPYVGTTVNVDITDLLQKIREKHAPFFFTVLYIAGNAANRIPEFRRRIHEDGIWEYSCCHTSHTVALEDETYCYCELDCSKDYSSFIPYASQRQDDAKRKGTIDNDSDEDSLLFVSCMPWLSYTAVVQPVPYPADSNPRITFGRYFEQNGRTLLPVTILANHALVDGLHIAKFYKNFEEIMAALIGDL